MLIKAILNSFMVIINFFKGIYNMFFKLRFFFFQNLYKIISIKIILLSTAITILYSCFLFELEINVSDYFIYYNTYKIDYYIDPEISIFVLNANHAFNNIVKVLFFFNGIVSFLILLHLFFAFISLIYDYLLKRLYLSNIYILVFFLLVSLQILLKIFFIIILWVL